MGYPIFRGKSTKTVWKETYQCDIRKKTMPGKIDVAEKEKLDLSEKLVK